MNFCIDLGHDNYTLKFQVLDTPVAELWIERMQSRANYPLDDPERFYGFGSPAEEETRAEQFINECITTINNFEPIIEREFTNIRDQDCLNYLHHIFEVYHGLLDQQTHEFWQRAPKEVQQALANLNIAVHRCETASREPQPRFVCTWYGLPKTKTLTPDLIGAYGVLKPEFGTVCLNYCEIGKTAEDLMQDNDQYIADDAFRPFQYYSADFVVRMFSESRDQVNDKMAKLKEYHNKHIDFFSSRGYNNLYSYAIAPYRFPVAQLIRPRDPAQIVADIAARQHINQVYFE